MSKRQPLSYEEKMKFYEDEMHGMDLLDDQRTKLLNDIARDSGKAYTDEDVLDMIQEQAKKRNMGSV
jgi:hypothetical protein